MFYIIEVYIIIPFITLFHVSLHEMDYIGIH